VKDQPVSTAYILDRIADMPGRLLPLLSRQNRRPRQQASNFSQSQLLKMFAIPAPILAFGWHDLATRFGNAISYDRISIGS